MNPSTNKTQDVIRYPLVLLTYAEASDMAGGGPTAAGYAAINLVRARAGEAAIDSRALPDRFPGFRRLRAGL